MWAMRENGIMNIQVKIVLGVKQILFISTIENKKKTVWGICIPIFGFKGLKNQRNLL